MILNYNLALYIEWWKIKLYDIQFYKKKKRLIYTKYITYNYISLNIKKTSLSLSCSRKLLFFRMIKSIRIKKKNKKYEKVFKLQKKKYRNKNQKRGEKNQNQN